MQAVYHVSYFCDSCSKSFHEPLDDFDFGDSKKMAIELGCVKYKCVYCDKRRKLEKTVFREFIDTLNVCIKQEPKTIKHQAARNTDTIGRAKREDKEFKYRESRRNAAKKSAEAAGGKLIERDPTLKPWWRDGTIPGVRKYAKATDLPVIKDPQKYIRTGEI
jgi:hypothetical protein